MSGERFGAEWLALREPYDTRAVAPDLVRRLAEWAMARPGLRVVDLGAGTGAMLRRLGPILGEGQQWTLAELDPELIIVGQARRGAGLPPAAYWRLDLARYLEILGGKPVNLTDEPYSNRRSIYGYIDRGRLPELMSQSNHPNEKGHRLIAAAILKYFGDRR